MCSTLSYMIELEKTYLVKYLPKGMAKCKHKEVFDVYFPAKRKHPFLRLRKNGDRYEMTKKQPVHGTDSSEQLEQTIPLDKDEFKNLSEARGKSVRKIRYYYESGGRTAEIDVFQDALKGLVLADFEFTKKEDKNNFAMPDFCLCDVTQDKFLAGGMLCGKSYNTISKSLRKFGYKKVELS